jgi:hypothetical protein
VNAILGSYPFTVTDTDSSQFPHTGSQQYIITADPCVVATSQLSRYLPGRAPDAYPGIDVRSG